MNKFLRFVGIYLILPVIVALAGILTSCSLVRLTGETVVLGSKVARETVKISSLVVQQGGKLGGAGIRYFSGSRVVKLEREGNSFFVWVRINGHKKIRLLLDTGATNVQISRKLAHDLGIEIRSKKTVNCTLADGSIVQAVPIILEKVQVGGVDVENVDALVLVHDDLIESEGLLGMSFLDNFRFELDTDRNILILKHAQNQE